jgi:aryl-alcohol dehydrogenase-like predicted oxidoreductase
MLRGAKELMDYLTIGSSDLRVAALGVGAWSWGERLIWGYGRGYGRADIAGAFQISLAAGITLFDTAEIYGRGASERILGDLVRESGADVVIASKYAPLPWRFSARALRHALDRSLERLGIDRLDLYQIHWPFPLVSLPSLMDALADAVADGKVRFVGISNYNADDMRRAHTALARRSVPLVSNQVEYSLLTRAPEVNGVLAACHELNVTLIAYSPLAMGLLTGKYRPGVLPAGPRRFSGRFSAQHLAAVQPVIAMLQQIGTAHGDRTAGQVALNWLIQRGVLPIPGAKNAHQASENAGALGWAIGSDDITALDGATRAWLR